jgi:cytidine deaminase
MLDLATKEHLIAQAVHSSTFSYSPYSHFAVGAALLSQCGSITLGANIENISFGLSNCAERSALFSALSAGIKDFKAIAIYSPVADGYLQPCGACRQVLSEFVPADFPLLLANKDGQFIETTLEQIFPMGFRSLGDAKKS